MKDYQNQHPLDRIITRFSYLNPEDKEFYTEVIDLGGSKTLGIEVRLDTRTFRFAPFFTEESAKDHAYDHIINMALDMLMNDDLFEDYHYKVSQKIREELENDEEEI